MTFAIRLLLWLGLLAVLTFFWVSVLDAGEEGVRESMRRNAADLKSAVFGRPES